MQLVYRDFLVSVVYTMEVAASWRVKLVASFHNRF